MCAYQKLTFLCLLQNVIDCQFFCFYVENKFLNLLESWIFLKRKFNLLPLTFFLHQNNKYLLIFVILRNGLWQDQTCKYCIIDMVLLPTYCVLSCCLLLVTICRFWILQHVKFSPVRQGFFRDSIVTRHVMHLVWPNALSELASNHTRYWERATTTT